MSIRRAIKRKERSITSRVAREVMVERLYDESDSYLSEERIPMLIWHGTGAQTITSIEDKHTFRRPLPKMGILSIRVRADLLREEWSFDSLFESL